LAIVGKYRIDPGSGNGMWLCEYFDKQSNRHVRHTLNLEELLDREMEQFFSHHLKCAQIFRDFLADDVDVFFEKYPQIIKYMPEVEAIPGFFQRRIDAFRYHLKSFVYAYNSMNCTNLSDDEIYLYLIEESKKYCK
jgi:hypothetical protein